jgi:hypothetical protein
VAPDDLRERVHEELQGGDISVLKMRRSPRENTRAMSCSETADHYKRSSLGGFG